MKILMGGNKYAIVERNGVRYFVTDTGVVLECNKFLPDVSIAEEIVSFCKDEHWKEDEKKGE